MVNCFESGLNRETGLGWVRDRHHHSPQGICRWMGSYYLKLLKLNWSKLLIKDKPRLKWGTQKTSDHNNSCHAHLKIKFNVIINVHKTINLNSTNSQGQAVFTNFDIRWSFQTCQISAGDVWLCITIPTREKNLWGFVGLKVPFSQSCPSTSFSLLWCASPRVSRSCRGMPEWCPGRMMQKVSKLIFKCLLYEYNHSL